MASGRLAVLSQIVLAPLAGLTVTAAVYRWAFTVNVVSFLASALLLLRLLMPRVPVGASSPSVDPGR